jgi:hypothetical protein
MAAQSVVEPLHFLISINQRLFNIKIANLTVPHSSDDSW